MLVASTRDSTTLVVGHQHVVTPMSLLWRVPAKVVLTDIPISGSIVRPVVGAERLLRDLEAGVPIVDQWNDEWLDRHNNGLVDYQNED